MARPGVYLVIVMINESLSIHPLISSSIIHSVPAAAMDVVLQQ